MQDAIKQDSRIIGEGEVKRRREEKRKEWEKRRGGDGRRSIRRTEKKLGRKYQFYSYQVDFKDPSIFGKKLDASSYLATTMKKAKRAQLSPDQRIFSLLKYISAQKAKHLKSEQKY